MRVGTGIAIGWLLCGSLSQAGAQELTGALKKIKATGTITLGHRESSVPFSYYDGKQRAVGYAMDLCGRVVEAVKQELKLTKLDVRLIPVTPANRIALVASGAIDMECGSTTNTVERQRRVAFSVTHYIAGNRFVVKAHSNLASLDDLAGKTVVSTAGTTSIHQLAELNARKGYGMTI
ncbi:MAG: amino acid ABC transporter substrate-binding protein, partial [Pseudorhodoplanes sp.]